MPSAANNKNNEKQINQESNPALAESSSQNLTPLRQAITIIEHKIRNLEKRKSKLESYKELQNAGKELNADQKTAVAKFNEVINTLDFARDLCKQFLGVASSTEKEAKKSAKKEAAVKYQSDLARLREILLVQDALNQMGNESVREDFLNGKNGAAQLSEGDLKLLDDLYPAVTPKHEIGNPVAFTNEVQGAAEHLLAVVDGKSKDVFGGTYSQIKEILGKIHESGYFDQSQVFETFEGETFVEPETPALETPLEGEAQPLEQVAGGAATQPVVETLTIESRNVLNSTVPVVDPSHVPVEPPQQPQQAPPQVDSTLPPFYQQVGPQPPPLQVHPTQQPRLTDVLGTGSFFFLQESEIEPTLEQIPSQTFTNQNFSTHPIPIQAAHFGANVPNNLAQQTNHHQVTAVQLSLTTTNNGIEEAPVMQPPSDDPKGVGRQTNPQATFYANNYNGRPRQQQQPQQQRNGAGPRAVNNRH